jgi:hypothetical protein
MHGFAEDDAHEALAAPGKRRVGGKAAQSLVTAFLPAGNIRKIRTFLTHARPDEDGTILVPRGNASATTPVPAYRQVSDRPRPLRPDPGRLSTSRHAPGPGGPVLRRARERLGSADSASDDSRRKSISHHSG